jgi:DNA-binding MarR family transcriptional regulator
MDRRELVEQAIKLQRQVNRLFREANSDAWMAMNLTRAQLKSLFFIGRENGTNFSKLADALGLSPSNLTGIIDRLVEKGLVTRSDNVEDRRVVVLLATDKGKALIAGLREHQVKYLSAILEHMNSEELSVLVEAYSTLVKAAKVHEKENMVDDKT